MWKSENMGCTLMTLASAAFLVAAVSAFKSCSFNDAQEQLNQLQEVVRTDTECQLLRDAQLALDRGQPATAHRHIEDLKKVLEENQ